MHSLHDSSPLLARSGMFAPVRFLRIQALGLELAFEAAALCAVLELGPVHAPLRLGRGPVMAHEGRIVPLVDYRAATQRGTALIGGQVVLATVQGRGFALMVDCVGERIGVDYAEIRLPEPALAERCPYLAGCIWRDGNEVYLVDLERLLGPAIRTYLNVDA